MRELSAIDALSLYEDALLGAPEGGGALHAVGEDGSRRPLPLGRWLGTPDRAEETVLDRAVGPVLDIGCGVGRHVVALRGRGVRAVGVEISRVAAAIARERGAEVIQASAFDHPTAAEWRTILLLDGNIGIGGDATRLLRRAASLLLPRGAVLVELEAPATAPRAQRVRLEGARATSSWVPWHFVGYEEIDRLARSAGFTVAERWQVDGRWFAQLRLEVGSPKPPGGGQKREPAVGAPAEEAAWARAEGAAWPPG